MGTEAGQPVNFRAFDEDERILDINAKMTDCLSIFVWPSRI
jgi:hypothetical protein